MFLQKVYFHFIIKRINKDAKHKAKVTGLNREQITDEFYSHVSSAENISS